jgi:hypothetical protein
LDVNGSTRSAGNVLINSAGSRLELQTSATTYCYFGDAAGILGTPAYSATDTALVAWTGKNLIFGTNATERARIDSSGNLGLGVTPSAWIGNRKVFQNSSAAFWTVPSGPDLCFLSANMYDDGTFKYIENGFASYYRQGASTHQWFTAPSGTAGNAITFTQAMTLTAAGDLGIGTTSPAAKLDVNGTLSATGNITVQDGIILRTNAALGGTSGRIVQTSTNGLNIWAQAGSANDLIFFNGAGTTTFQVPTGTTNLRLAGNLILASGAGIDFSATGQAAGMTSELLDDYEEGTWTPAVGGTATYTTQTGHYTKVGRLVTVSFTLKVNVLGTGSTTQISGLPFSTTVGIAATSSAMYFDGPIASSIVNLVGTPTGAGDAVITLYANTAAANAVASVAIFGDDARVIGTFTYQV